MSRRFDEGATEHPSDAAADGLADFLDSVSPNIRAAVPAEGTLGAQASYQMTDIKLMLRGHHTEESATWDLLRKNSYALAGAMALATVRQFPNEFVQEIEVARQALSPTVPRL